MDHVRYPTPVRWLAVTLLTLLCLAMGGTAVIADAPSLVANGDFVLPDVGPTQTAVIGDSAPSSAPNWLIWNNDAVTTSTEVLSSTMPGSAGRMLHVAVAFNTTVTGSGIYQQFGTPNDGPGSVHLRVWLYVLSGQVGVGTGNDGDTGIDGATATTGQWELVEAPSGGAPVNEVIIYAINGPADFYVGQVVVQPDGE